MKRIVLLALFVFAFVVSRPVAAQNNPYLGTWKLNLAKSKFEGTSAPKSLTRTVEPQGAGAKYTYEGTTTDGKPITYSFSSNYDGVDSPVTGSGAPFGADTISIKLKAPGKAIATLKKGGKVVATSTSEVSSNGKWTTLEAKGTNPDGKPASSKTVFEKVM